MYDEDNHEIEWTTGAKKTFNMAISALEKRIPKKVRIEQHPKYGRVTFCPNCNYMDMECWSYSYCPVCGQAIDWSDFL